MATESVVKTRAELAALLFGCGSCGRHWHAEELIVKDLDVLYGSGKKRTIADPKFAHLAEFNTQGLVCQCGSAVRVI